VLYPDYCWLQHTIFFWMLLRPNKANPIVVTILTQGHSLRIVITPKTKAPHSSFLHLRICLSQLPGRSSESIQVCCSGLENLAICRVRCFLRCRRSSFLLLRVLRCIADSGPWPFLELVSALQLCTVDLAGAYCTIRLERDQVARRFNC